MLFPADYQSILHRIENIKPLQYAANRNFIDGDVTYLSPYISRGVISLPQIAAALLKKYRPFEIEKFLQELAWREYWQSVWQHQGDKIYTDLKQPQQKVLHHQMVKAVFEATTGIQVIEEHIQKMYDSGYMHNHVRMYVSSIICNVAGAHWLLPSKWMYYHLLDGDLASNSVSWQWVAGAFAAKKYYCNQENINHYTRTHQTATFLDVLYNTLTDMPVPPVLQSTVAFTATTQLPPAQMPVIDHSLPVLLYNSYNLDPLWHKNENANRILLLEPSHFKKFPVSKKVVDFIISLTGNIPGMQVFTGEWEDIKNICAGQQLFFKAHSAFTHYTGNAEKYDALFPGVQGYYPSFSAYWKQCRKDLNAL